jgi:hypothetical protein
MKTVDETEDLVDEIQELISQVKRSFINALNIVVHLIPSWCFSAGLCQSPLRVPGNFKYARN